MKFFSVCRALATTLLVASLFFVVSAQCRGDSLVGKSRVVSPQNNDKIYTFGVVPQFEQRKLFRIWLPILAELEKRTGLKFKLKGSAQIPVFEKKFLEGGFDFAYMNPYQVIKAYHSQGYIPLVRDGTHKLRGILVVQADSKLFTPRDLQGKQIAFPAPNSLGASLLLRADLAEQFNISFRPRYVQTHSSVYLHVVKGLVSAGGGVDQTLDAQAPEVREKLRVIYRTRETPPHPIAVHPRVPEEDREKVKTTLLEMAKDKNILSLFEKIPMKSVVGTDIHDYAKLESWKLDRYYVSEDGIQ